jgi:predicted small metal-binding protein
VTTTEERVTAALAVLGGRDPADVADEHHVEPELVRRWADLYSEGGTLRLSGRMDLTSFEARDRFLVLIAHEFRTPLTIIGGWVETMLGTDLPADLRDEALEVIRKQVAHLDRIARDALDAGAVARGQLRLVVGPVELRGLVAAVVSSLRDARVELASGPEVDVVADASRLEQVVGGVLEHARRIAGDNPVAIVIDGSRPDRVTGGPPCGSASPGPGQTRGRWSKGSDMPFSLTCGDVMPGCAARFQAGSRDDLLSEVAAHARTDHGLDEISPEVLEQVMAAIHQTV